jgi:signal transduction histidine kinase
MVAAFAVALVATAVIFNVLLQRSLSSDATRLAEQRAAARQSTIGTEGGRIRIPEASGIAAGVDGPTWVFAGTRALERPQAPPSVQAAARRLAVGPARTLALEDPETRLASVPIVADGRRLGAVVAAVPFDPYERTRHRALIASGALAGSLLVVVAAATAWALRAALRPVARMTADAAAWSERDVERRFDVGEPYDELTRLAKTLDGLLARLAASLRHERRFSAELSHELRTPLATITAEAELALRRERQPAEYRESLASVLRHARQLTHVVDTLVAAARQDAGVPGGVSDARAAARRAAESCERLAEEGGVAIEVERQPGPVRVGVDGDVVERILQPIIENACRYGRSKAIVSFDRGGGQVLILVRDDGPGLDEQELERVFEPGARGSAAAADPAGGAGLGLALSRRLARAAGGEVTAAGANGAGAALTVRLPAA